MNILIVGTLSLASSPAFLASKYGVDIIGHLPWPSDSQSADFIAMPVFSLAEIAGLKPDWIVLDLPDENSYQQAFSALLATGVETSKFIDARNGPGACIAAFAGNTGGYGLRDFSTVNETIEIRQKIHGVTGKHTADCAVDAGSPEHVALVDRLLKAFYAAQRDNAEQPAALQVGANWQQYLKNTRPNFYAAVQRGDALALAALLANFCRNEMSTGVLGGAEAFTAFANAASDFQSYREVFNVWKYSVENHDLLPLRVPSVGNPYGMTVDGHVININNFYNDSRAQRTLSLLDDRNQPVIVEVGGGFGGYASALSARGFQGTYINFDLAESLVTSSYFLSLAHPDKRILLYSEGLDAGLVDLISQYDIIMMPQYMIRHMPHLSADLCFNSISLSEMDYRNICSYLDYFSKISHSFFMHENMLDCGEGYRFFPTSVFPQMPDFHLLYSAPSRWPFFSLASRVHFHAEYLYQRRGDRL